MLSEFNEVVLNFSAYTLVGLNFYGRSYLTNAGKKFSYEWANSGRLPVDKLDLKILELLTKNARMSSVEIAERLNQGSHNVRYRIERMEKLEIITRYHVTLDLHKLGVLFFKTQFFLRNYELSLREQMVEYCKRSPHVTCYIQQIGDCNVELEMEVEDHQQHYQIIDDIRGNSSKLIRNFHSILIREARYRYLPHDIVEGLGLESEREEKEPERVAA
jgi:DNA-binding Lrp family transcriptional regulator